MKESNMEIEGMREFFAARVREYDDHMLNSVEGCREGYIKMAQLLPESAQKILDLGCGTGLELDEIFKKLPKVKVTGIDLTPEMLNVLKLKHFDKDLTLINENYFNYDLGVNEYDAVISFQTMHHYLKEDKIGLYNKIKRALKWGGIYIECDYMAADIEEERAKIKEYLMIKKQMGISDEMLYHIDIPYSVESQINMLEAAGFKSPELKFKKGNTAIIVGYK